jgi:putative DNA primase/helicase
MAESLMKQVTGGDRMRARRMRQDFFEFDQTWHIFLAANHKPVISGTDHAVWRRIKLVPWEVTIPEAEKDKSLLDKLKAEAPGILNWALDGCLAWQKDGLREPEEVIRATDAYRAEQDLLGVFIEECCFVRKDSKDVKIQASVLLSAYQKWTGDKELTAVKFSKFMEGRSYRKDKGGDGCKYWLGLGLLANEGQPEGY